MEEETRKKLIDFLLRHLKILPGPYSAGESSSVVLLYYILDSLDILSALDLVPEERRKEIVEWVYSLQIHASSGSEFCGFRGSRFLCGPSSAGSCNSHVGEWDHAHIAMTYSSLLILRILGDDHSRVQKKDIVDSLKRAQRPDGSYGALLCGDSEHDLRFTYCAGAISAMLNDWSGVDVDQAVQFVMSCQSYEGGFGLNPGAESHGGSTYCGLAFLKLAEDSLGIPCFSNVATPKLLRWLMARQVSGFNGRTGKQPDSCYSFWIGASLAMMGKGSLPDRDVLVGHVAECWDERGGFGKEPGNLPDLLHTHFSLCGLSLAGRPGVQPIESRLASVIHRNVVHRV